MNKQCLSVPLVDPENIFFPFIHIKIGLKTNLVKAMGKVNSQGFQYLSKKFPQVSAVKLKEGFFVHPQIREVLIHMEFQQSISPLELKAWWPSNGYAQISWGITCLMHIGMELRNASMLIKKWRLFENALPTFPFIIISRKPCCS